MSAATVVHASDCSLHNEPAKPNTPCDCDPMFRTCAVGDHDFVAVVCNGGSLGRQCKNCGWLQEGRPVSKKKTEIEQFYRMHETAMKRIYALEQQVSNQALQIHDLKNPKDVPTQSPEVLKSQAAATQATAGFIHPGDASACDPTKSLPAHMVYPAHLYAPLRSDTKPLLEMSAFVREIADEVTPEYVQADFAKELYVHFVRRAQEILKRST